MPQNAREIYKNLQNVYGNSLSRIFENNYSSDGQCDQFNSSKAELFMPINLKHITENIKDIQEEGIIN